MAFDISKFKKNTDVAQATERLQKARDQAGQDQGSSWQSVLDVSKVPYAVKWWTPTAGTHYIDIIGTLVTNPRNPAVRNGSIGIGDYDFGLQLWTHPDGKGGGPKGLPHVCLKRNGYAANCPRCEEFFKPKEDGGTYVRGVKGSGNTIHRSSERTFLIIVPRENLKTPGTEVFFWETSVFAFTSELLEEANALAAGGTPAFFWWPTDSGATIEFSAKEGDLKGAFDFKRFKFHPRPEAVGSMLYEKWSFPLDSILRIPTAEQMEDEMYGRPDDEEEQGSHTSQEATSTSRKDEYHREVEDSRETRPQSRQDLVEDGNWKAKETTEPEKTKEPEKAKAKGAKECPEGFQYGVTSVEENKRECRKCDLFDKCVDNK